jgi:hypothetical protein
MTVDAAIGDGSSKTLFSWSMSSRYDAGVAADLMDYARLVGCHARRTGL